MLLNYLKIAFRNLVRNRTFSVVNILGLALGMAAFLLILEYVSQEKSVNGFHTNLSQMVRLLNEDPKGETWAQVEPGWAARMKTRFPEIADVCQFAEGITKGIVRRSGEQSEPFRENEIGYGDGHFFSFFSFPLVSGQPEALAKPNVVFISQKTAQRYFGAENPVGQTLQLANQFGTRLFTVEGVYADMTEQSDIRFDMVFSLETLRTQAKESGNDWANLDNLDSQFINTFFRLANGTDVNKLAEKLSIFRKSLSQEKDGVRFRLQPFAQVHLADSFSDTYQHTGNVRYVTMLSLIAALMLLIAWFNYINLSTAASLKRAGEVGVRKAIGASRSALIGQFLGESLLLNALSFGLAIGLVMALQSTFNNLIGRQLSLQSLGFTSTWIVGLSGIVLGSLAAGAFTAFRLAGFDPAQSLRGYRSKQTGSVRLRQSLVVVQFTISIVLMLGTVLIYRQLQYMQTKNLGINTQQLLVINGPEVGKDSSYKQRKSAFWQAIARESFVKDYSMSGSVPSGWYNFSTSGFTQPGSHPGDDQKTYSFVIIDNRYLNTYQIGLKAGRNFTATECAVDWNDNSKVMLNETAVRQLGFHSPEEAIRTRIRWDERYLEVVGVVKDYHHTGVQRAIDPIIFYPQLNSGNATIRLTANQLPQKIAQLEQLYKASFPGNPFEYFFVDDNFNKLYVSEQQYGTVFATASGWAIFIACLGLFGLATFMTEQRTKEIGVRKVLGASVASIVSLLSKDFLKLVFLAIVIASPLAWWAMRKWLEGFAYQVSLDWWMFALAGLLAVGIAILTVSFQSIKAALMNPVTSLRAD